MCSKLNIKDQRRAARFCPDSALKVMESQQKGSAFCKIHLAALGGVEREKWKLIFFSLSKFVAPSI